MVYIIILMLVVMALAITTAAGITTVAEQIEELKEEIHLLREDCAVTEQYLDYQIRHMKEGEDKDVRNDDIENLKAIASDMPSDKCSDWIESLMAGVKALEQVHGRETRQRGAIRNEN